MSGNGRQHHARSRAESNYANPKLSSVHLTVSANVAFDRAAYDMKALILDTKV
jgi:hypothetical protein